MVVRSSDEKSLPPRCGAIPVGRIPAIILAPRRDRMELARIIIRKGDGMRDVERKRARGKRRDRKRVGAGKSVAASVDHGGSRVMKNKNNAREYKDKRRK